MIHPIKVVLYFRHNSARHGVEVQRMLSRGIDVKSLVPKLEVKSFFILDVLVGHNENAGKMLVLRGKPWIRGLLWL
jgi:hypothetical protein